MFLHSIRFRITLWYMVILAVTLLVFSAIVYHNVSHWLLDDLEDVLQSRAEGIVTSIDTYWEIEKLDILENKTNRYAFSKANNENFKKIAQRWASEQSKDPILLGIIVQIFDANAGYIVSSKNINELRVLSQEALAAVAKGKDIFYTVSAEIEPGKKMPLRVYVLPVFEQHHLAYIVQVALQISVIQVALRDLRLILLFLLPLTVVVTGIAGAFLAKITLDPVTKMIQTIHKITAQNMKLRIAIPDTKDEIKRLADTFNEMLERLEHSFRSQRQFIEDLTHELKTPLAVLQGELEVTLKKMRSPQEYSEVLHSNLEEVRRISRIVENLLLLARFDSSAIELQFKIIDLVELVEAAITSIDVLAIQKHITLVFSKKESLVIKADEEKLKRVFLNMIDNAIRYSPEHGKVSVSMTKADRDAVVTIADTGIGIAEEEIPFIFDRFYRVDKSRSSVGYGLGLSIAKSIVEAHQGKIHVASVPRQGTTFTITLPLP